MKNQTINYCKAIACMCVVLIHAKFPGTFGALVDAFSRTAVAYFFVISGWFSYFEDRSVAASRCTKRLTKTCVIFAVSVLVYLLWGCFLEAVRGGAEGAVHWIKDVFSINRWGRFFLLNEVAAAEPLWFLPALVYCYAVWLAIERLHWERIAGAASVALLLLALLGQTITIDPINKIVRTAWLYGMPVFMLANRMHAAWNKKRPHRKTIVSAIFASCLLIYAEWQLLGNLQFSAGNLCLAFSLFAMSVNSPALLSNKIVCTIGERYSMYVYILHWAMMSVVLKFASILGFEGNHIFSWVYPLVVFAATLAAAIVVEYVVMKILKKSAAAKER